MRRTPRQLALIWFGMTLLGTALWAAATWTDSAPVPRALEAPIKITANTLDTIATPGWALVRIAGLGGRGIPAAGVANALTWAFLLGLLAMVFGVRKQQSVAAPNSPSANTDPTVPIITQSRRAFIVRSALAVPACAGAGGLLMATAVGPWQLRTRRYTVPISDLPPALDGTRLALLTDTHLGRRIPRAHIEHAVGVALDLRPHAFILGGDYVDHAVANIEEGVSLFAPLVATGRPVMGVLGNHDYYADAAHTVTAMRAAGITVLVNDRRFLTPRGTLLEHEPSDSDTLCIAGIDDLWEGSPDLDIALRDVRSGTPRLVVSHNPDMAESPTSTPHRIDLMLSGHTHGGQVAIPFIGTPVVPSRYGQKYARGLVRGPRFPVVVSAGIGMAVAPVRLGVPPEVVEVELVRASSPTLNAPPPATA